jgi:uncharacterized membrane protein
MKHKLLKNKKGVFGLPAIQSFFAIILAIALLGYIIVVIMGVLSGTTILEKNSGSVVNESGYINHQGYTLAQSTRAGFSGATITTIYNTTDGVVVLAGNYTLTNNVLKNATGRTWNDTITHVKITYTYKYNSVQQNDLGNVLINTSTGISGFYSSITPVYAILAILVIILILVVLVRVVQTPNERATPSL